jgi:hypothetical protein
MASNFDLVSGSNNKASIASKWFSTPLTSTARNIR